MKEYIIKAKHYSGSATVSFDDNGIARSFQNDLNGLDSKQLKYIFGHLATEGLMRSMLTKVGPGVITAEEVQKEISFDQFYDKYDYKVKRQRALNTWNRMSKAEQWRAWSYLPKYEAFLRTKGVAKMYPSTYLNDKPWLD